MNERPKVSRLSEGIHAVDTSAPESVTLFQGMTEKERIIAQYGQKRDMSKIVVIPAKPAPSLFDTERRKRVVVYCRVSTDGISQTSSFELQKNHYLKYVRQKISLPDTKSENVDCWNLANSLEFETASPLLAITTMIIRHAAPIIEQIISILAANRTPLLADIFLKTQSTVTTNIDISGVSD